MSVAGDTAYLASGLVEQIESEAIVAFSDAGVISNLTRSSLQANADTISFQVVNRGTNKINSADVGAVTDGTEIAASVINTDKKTITLAPYAVRTDAFDDAKYSNISDQAGFIGPILGNAAAAYLDKTLGELFADFNTGNDVGVSSVGLTVDNLYLGLANLRAQRAPGMPVGVFHPKQIVGTYGLMNDLVTSNQFGGSPDLQNVGLREAYVDRIAGIDIYQSLEVELHDTNYAYGGIFVKDAMAWGSKDFGGGMPFWVEYERFGTYQRDTWLAHMFFGVVELDDFYGCQVDTRLA